MKCCKILVAAVGALFTAQAAAQNSIFDEPIVPPGSEIVLVEADEIFVPSGFDDNDDAVAVIDGFLPDSCYRITHNETVVNQETGTIKIIQMARRFAGLCLPVQVPFWSEVNLGVLPMGTFELQTAGADSEQLVIEEAANAGPDDFLYAPVESARVESDFTNNRHVAIIQGRFTNTCMVWDDVKLIPQDKTFVVLPVVKMEDRADCVDTEIPFSWMLDLPEGLDARRYLLHVRSLNGKAINQMFSVREPVEPPVQ